MKLFIVGALIAMASAIRLNSHETIDEPCFTDSDCPSGKHCYSPIFNPLPYRWCVVN